MHLWGLIQCYACCPLPVPHRKIAIFNKEKRIGHAPYYLEMWTRRQQHGRLYGTSEYRTCETFMVNTFILNRCAS